MFKNKILAITGGTGSFGQGVLARMLPETVSEIRIFSRDEKKQDDMRRAFHNHKINFYLGDVRDRDSIKNALRGVDYVFHAAALKQVPSCEFYPIEAVKTNIIGTDNVLEIAIECGVQKVICLSTDKAVYPVNAMGISKSMMEKIAIAKSRNSSKTEIICTRYGNVVASRGSVIPLFLDQAHRNMNLTVTDPNMSRFIMSIPDAIELVLYAFQHGKSGDIFVQKSPATKIGLLAEAIIESFPDTKSKIEVIGTRHGEKLYETLLSREEMTFAKDWGGYFSISPDVRDLNYQNYYENGDLHITETADFNSQNAEQLNKNQIKDVLIKLGLINPKIAG